MLCNVCIAEIELSLVQVVFVTITSTTRCLACHLFHHCVTRYCWKWIGGAQPVCIVRDCVIIGSGRLCNYHINYSVFSLPSIPPLCNRILLEMDRWRSVDLYCGVWAIPVQVVFISITSTTQRLACHLFHQHIVGAVGDG